MRFPFASLIFLIAAINVHAWQSELVGPTWAPPTDALDFRTDKIIQDFSYAGYRRGETPLPEVLGPIFNVADYGADETGASDSTLAIQSAIDAAGLAGGGVVFLPEGSYRVSRQPGKNYCLLIEESHIILRGSGPDRCFILNTDTEMRNSDIIRFSASGYQESTPVAFTEDLTGPTKRIPVADTSGFSVGDHVILKWDFTSQWIGEHGQRTWWSASSRPSSGSYQREIIGIDKDQNELLIDIPIRYMMLLRDNARIARMDGQLVECGTENLSIGNLAHPGNEWAEEDYSKPGNSAYDTHASSVIKFRYARDCYIRSVRSFQAAENGPSGAHLLSNGIALEHSSRLTLFDCYMGYPQYGGGGGNGYMYRLTQTADSLLQYCVADFSRHGIVLSHSGTTGNVILDSIDRESGRATGSSGGYATSGRSSDNHMHFSHSNLFDNCLADNSYYAAAHRQSWGTVPHALTAAHTVYWNTRGTGTRYPQVVHTEQGRYGYVIGTSGDVVDVLNTTGGNTAPLDHVEGIGNGDGLEPRSLYREQIDRRIGLYAQVTSPQLGFPNNSSRLSGRVFFDGLATEAYDGVLWELLHTPHEGNLILEDETTLHPQVTLDKPGRYVVRLRVEMNGETRYFEHAFETQEMEAAVLEVNASEDSHTRGGTYSDDNYGSATTLSIKTVNDPSFQREAYLKFPIAVEDNAGYISSATLNLTGSQSHSGATGELLLVADDSWIEEAISWNTAPPAISALAQFAFPQNGELVELPMEAALIQAAIEDGFLTLKVRIISQENPSDVPAVHARESASPASRPILKLVRKEPDFNSWMTTIAEVPSELAAVNDDADGDGIANGLETVFGSDPGEADGYLFRIGMTTPETAFLEFSVRRQRPRDIYFLLEQCASLDIGEWTPVTGIQYEQIGSSGELTFLRARIPIKDTVSRFFRFTIRLF